MRTPRTLLAATGALTLALSMSACSSGPSEKFLNAQDGLESTLASLKDADATLEEELAAKAANPHYINLDMPTDEIQAQCHQLQMSYVQIANKFDEADFEDSDLPWDPTGNEDSDCA